MASYARKTLIDGEKVIKDAKFHWMKYFWPLLGLSTSITYLALNFDDSENGFPIWIIFIIILIWSFVHLITIHTYAITLTNYRIVAQKSNELLELQLYEIDSIIVKSAQDSYDTMTICGQGLSMSIPYVIGPLSLRKLILNTQKELLTQPNVNGSTYNPQAKFCRYCGNEIMPDSTFCPKCGKRLINTNNPSPQYVMQNMQPRRPNRTTVVVQTSKSNGMGTAGFIFAILGIIVSWAPGVNFVIWFLGFLFSFIGLFKSPRGMALTGFILSILGIIIIITIFGSILALLSKIF